MILLNADTKVTPLLTYISVCVGGNVNYNVYFNKVKVYVDKDLENGYIGYYNSLTYLDNDILVKNKAADSNDDNGNPEYDSYMYRDIITHYASSSSKCQELPADRLPTNFTHRHSGVHPSTVSNGCPILFNTLGGSSVKLRSAGGEDIHEIDCSGKRLIFINNLIPGCQYTYQIYKNSTLLTSGTFSTYGSIRLITMEGVLNIRDIGGKTVNNVNRLKYGKIFRGGLPLPRYYNNETGGKYNWTKYRRYLNSDPSSDTIVAGGATENDVAEFKRLNIGVDIDLRDPSSNSGYEKLKSGNYPFFADSDNIDYYSIRTASNANVQSYANIFGDNGRKLFKLFAEKLLLYLSTDKAAYVHCLQGKDRTGTFIGILEILLGVSTDGLIKDYELTSLWGLNAVTRNTFNTTFANIGSDTLYNYVYNTFVGTGSDLITVNLLNTLKGLLVEQSSTPTPKFEVKDFRVSSSGLELVHETTTHYWRYAQVYVQKGYKVTLSSSSAISGWFIYNSSDLYSSLNGTEDIAFESRVSLANSSVSTGVYEYTATKSGYVLMAAYKADGATLNISVTEEVTPSEQIDFTEVNVKVKGWEPNGASSAGTLTGYTYHDETYESWSHYEINVAANTLVECRYVGTLAAFYAESKEGMIKSMTGTKVTSGWSEAAYVYSTSKNGSDGEVFVSVTRKTVNGVGCAKHIIYIRNNGKLTISVKRKPTGASYAYPVNTSSSDSLQFLIINNGDHIYGPVINL